MAASASASLTSLATEEELTLTVKWSGKEYTVRVCGDESVAELKRRICELTNVLPKRQKLLYPKIGNKLSDDSVLLSELPLKSSLKMTMIGSRTNYEGLGQADPLVPVPVPLHVKNIDLINGENSLCSLPLSKELFLDPSLKTIDISSGSISVLIFCDTEYAECNYVNCYESASRVFEMDIKFHYRTIEDDIIVDQVDSPEIVDDFELGQDEAVDIKDKEVNKQKLRRRIDQFKIELKNPCRPGKKLLVLDIDYTLFDHRSTAENPLELMRPYLHEFLTAVYAEYDIMIWSATSMKWVELKMGQLGVLNNSNYKITALLDHLAMITVQSDSRGIFDCKPLGLIWAKFPEFYSSKNTIMFDDLRRNFVMNPQNGLVIKPFRKAHANRDNDQELVKLTQYLLAIADLDDLSVLDHKNWEFFAEDNTKRRRHGFDPLDPFGNITIKWDLILAGSGTNNLRISIYNFQQYRHVDPPGWKLNWAWKGEEVIWSMQGAEATEQGNCSAFQSAVNPPHCCEKKPVIVDLLPGAKYNMQSQNCCKGGVLTSIKQDPSKYGATFEMTVGGSVSYSEFKMPENFSLGVPGYSCGQAIDSVPTKYTTDGGRRWTQALSNPFQKFNFYFSITIR
ncbi:unnamed protein product [Dovyalis caffra]|uniref:protein-serine/threonine phosphatase n=1 Tax=Dovyalis caffra TaxID=77055 RepID=A0AAV1SSQ6_9ROSI|nr:unnamed protein product [Dovyalis caffra]